MPTFANVPRGDMGVLGLEPSSDGGREVGREAVNTDMCSIDQEASSIISMAEAPG